MKDAVKLPGDLVARFETLSEPVSRIPGVLFVYLFGSAASDRMRPSSDVDLAIYLDGSADAFETRLEIFAVASKHLGTVRLAIGAVPPLQQSRADFEARTRGGTT